ncbi:Stk1 family PASTA domain-containing Ser/Thr kinase [Paenibacillus allorhizosphaerae]|uniref:non-specific serine/threonine protein kinase n=1 Tax=Paenibacillus allorhizosphaerae TaxID=2849866 RepID=A0ABM8VCD7_9BACL|nr:Stk1 family PASTA domain-containing Ser/Thr kinase [Paenibacillus allorhizosphaerae]CAG7622940.1 Serine/threonine-protein kinase PrkC [Paenibacillus allorhizosphaerae]
MIGKQLGGRYEILERVGGGGMAIVYKGLDILLHRHIAVKVLRQQYVHDEEFIHRFRREAQAAASLSHPNVVSIYDVGQEDDVHYIVMEYVEGTTLNELIKEKAPLQVEEAIHIAGQICDALDHAHHNQIIHRDIKPHNILIGKNGRVKVTDFGIARAVTSSTITQTGSVVGSVHYFSPEHAKGTPTGEQSDLYSLGIVMYQMLTGRLPFLGESPISVALKHLQEDVEEPRKVNPLIPQSVENIILRAMRKSTSERYRSAKDMLNDLDTCLLPHRRNEPKLNFEDEDEMDEERTRVMPALRPGQYTVSDDDEEDADEMPVAVPSGKKKRRWVKPLVWFIVLMALLGGMWYAVGYAKKMLEVPETLVPNVVNKPLAEAQQLLKDAGLENEVEYQPSKDVAKDIVIRQNQADIKVKLPNKIKLYVSQGVEMKKMPEVTKKNVADAKQQLTNLGIIPENITVASENSDVDPDTVTKQTPNVNEDIDPATVKVSLTVSKGPATIPMPNLLGKMEAEAKSTLEKSNLKLAKEGITFEASYKAPKGRVIKQFPYEPDELVAPGSEIKLVISSGLPEDAGQMKVSVPVTPAREGIASTVRIILSDAVSDNKEVQKVSNVMKAESVDVNLVVSPDKNAVITVKVDEKNADLITVTYQNYLDQKAGKPFVVPSKPSTTSTGSQGTGNGSQPASGTPTPPAGGTTPPAGGTANKPVNAPVNGGTGSTNSTNPPSGSTGNTTNTGGRN